MEKMCSCASSPCVAQTNPLNPDHFLSLFIKRACSSLNANARSFLLGFSCRKGSEMVVALAWAESTDAAPIHVLAVMTSVVAPPSFPRPQAQKPNDRYLFLLSGSCFKVTRVPPPPASLQRQRREPGLRTHLPLPRAGGGIEAVSVRLGRQGSTAGTFEST